MVKIATLYHTSVKERDVNGVKYVYVVNLQPWGDVDIELRKAESGTNHFLPSMEPELLAWAFMEATAGSEGYLPSHILMVKKHKESKVCVVYAINANGQPIFRLGAGVTN